MRTILLVARREVAERSRTRAFRISLAGALPAAAQGGKDRVRVRRLVSATAARAAVRSGKLDAALIGDSVVVKSDTASQPARMLPKRRAWPPASRPCNGRACRPPRSALRCRHRRRG